VPHLALRADRIRRATALAVGAAALVGPLTACGGSARVDNAAFTARDRSDAQAVLDTLRASSIPTTLVQTTGIAAATPAVCRVRVKTRRPQRFELFLFWVPPKIKDPVLGSDPPTYTWFDATLTKNLVEDQFHIGHVPTGQPSAAVLAAHSNGILAAPGASCELLANGYLALQKK
jgi:hypothetical protein